MGVLVEMQGGYTKLIVDSIAKISYDDNDEVIEKSTKLRSTTAEIVLLSTDPNLPPRPTR